MKYFKELLISVLILSLFWAVLNDRIKAKKLAEYETIETKYKSRFDSLTKLQREADLHAIRMETDFNVARNQLREQSKITERITIKYETLRRLGPVRLTDAQIDSAANALYPVR